MWGVALFLHAACAVDHAKVPDLLVPKGEAAAALTRLQELVDVGFEEDDAANLLEDVRAAEDGVWVVHRHAPVVTVSGLRGGFSLRMQRIPTGAYEIDLGPLRSVEGSRAVAEELTLQMRSQFAHPGWD